MAAVALAGRANTATSTRAPVNLALRLAGRAATATGAHADVTRYLSPPAPGPYARFRNAVAAVLDGLTGDCEVHPAPTDSLTPPAYLLQWADPWSTPATHCLEATTLEIVCIAGRIEPDPGIETLEVMVAAALAALQVAGIPHGPTSAPRLFEVAGVPYLSARITVSGTVNIGAN